MAYIQVRRGKPIMYQVGERDWVCKGRDQVGTGVTARGAYTLWKNLVAMAELPSDEADQFKLRRIRAARAPLIL